MVNLGFCEFVFNSQDITAAAMRACRDAISSNSIPAFRRGIDLLGFSFAILFLWSTSPNFEAGLGLLVMNGEIWNELVLT